MRVYLDSSAVLKQVVAEADSPQLVAAVDDYHQRGAALVASTLAWVEVSRALRRLAGAGHAEVADDVDDALSGVAEQPLQPAVTALARRVGPHVLRSLDAIHVASALLIDADVVLTYDDRLAEACTESGLRVTMPGRTLSTASPTLSAASRTNPA